MFCRAEYCQLSHDTIRIPIQGSLYDTSMSVSTFQITGPNNNKHMDTLLTSTISGSFSDFETNMSPNF